MTVPFLDLPANAQSIKQALMPKIEEIIDTAAFVGGKYLQEFETAFAQMQQVKHCIGTSSGTAGNHLALWVLGIGHGDEVIVPVNTFIATAWGVTLCGATPVFVDSDPESYTIDPAQLEAAITPRTKAIVAVHLYGQSADMDAIISVAQKHGLYVVEDAAQAHLATYKGRPVGGIGITSSFSFYPGKNLGAFGEGGAVATQDMELAERLRAMRDHGSMEKYHHIEQGHNYRMSHIIAASLETKLTHIATWTARRRSNAALYARYLGDIEEIVLPVESSYAAHVWHLYVIRTPHREALMAHLQKRGIATGLHYPIPLHRQKVFAALGYGVGDFPVAEIQADEILSLPMYPELSEEQIAYVATEIKAFFGGLR